MTITDFKIYFFEALSPVYSEKELGSIFSILAEKYIRMSRLDIALQPQKVLTQQENKDMKQALDRLQRHEPVQYITGETEFFGLPFRVNPNVLIPRPETEELVQWIIEDLQKVQKEAPAILDIGTGSGCIAISLAKSFPDATVSAVDISPEALLMAQENADLNKVKVNFMQRNILLEKVPGKYDIIVSNPPYVRELEKDSMHKNVLDFEPSGALYVPDRDPLIFYQRIAVLATESLLPDGRVYCEVNQYLGQETENVLRKKHFHTRLKKDIFGVDRMLKGSKP